MTRTYEYNDLAVQVSVESDVCNGPIKCTLPHPVYVAVVRIFEAGSGVPRLS